MHRSRATQKEHARIIAASRAEAEVARRGIGRGTADSVNKDGDRLPRPALALVQTRENYAE